MNAALRLDRVSKVYRDGEEATVALDGLSLEVPRGSFLSVMGPSGSGKSTLMHCAAGLDTPTSGTVHIGDTEVSRLNETKRTLLRRGKVGFVFQSYNLVPALTVQDNITLPLRLAGTPSDPAWLRLLAERAGIDHLLHRRPAQLSGGQQQRAALIRALAVRPEVVFADEPTGALDMETSAGILALLSEMVAEFGQTTVMVTHDPVAAAWTHRAVLMADGAIRGIVPGPTAEGLAGALGAERGRRVL
ncbi:ABC transporter ATP-binding protein [Salininema proteolyticum]|uniref:ABC transporter ATP-binding protein n=1 Tax=Salininema proteolyticum TaxID=1607685 RepID=A0ABV8U0C8_9ACTN